MRILCIGDSNTWGYVPIKGKRYEQRWTKLLAKKFSEIEILEEGMNGRTITEDEPMFPERNGLKNLQRMLEKHSQVDKVIIMLGTNELKFCFDLTAKDIAEHLNIYIKKVKNFYLGKFAKIPEIICISPASINSELFNNDFTLTEFNEKSYNESLVLGVAIKDMLIKNHTDIVLIDLHKEGVEASVKDCIHLEKEGHKRIADLLSLII